MKIVGIDPGLAATGIGIISGTGKQIEQFSFGTVRTTPQLPLPERLSAIYSKIQQLLTRESPDLVVMEEVFSLNKYPKSGIALGQVTGVVLLAANQSHVPTIQISVREAKQILTGNGNASKGQLEKVVRDILNCKTRIKPDHASDALGLAIIGLYRHTKV